MRLPWGGGVGANRIPEGDEVASATVVNYASNFNFLARGGQINLAAGGAG